MEIEFAILAEKVESVTGGIFSMKNGNIGSVTATVFPVPHVAMMLVIRLALLPADCARKHRYKIDLYNANKQLLVAVADDTFLYDGKLPTGNQKAAFMMYLTLRGLYFDAPGVFTLHIALDGRLVKKLSIEAHLKATDMSLPTEDERGRVTLTA